MSPEAQAVSLESTEDVATRLDREGWPAVTVNVLSFNRRAPLTTTLRTLIEDLDYPEDRLEIVVVDNGSTDGTPDMVRTDFPAVRLIETHQNLGVPAWNRGFECGGGDWFLVLDDDCHISGDALRRAVASAVAEDADLVSFLVYSAGRDWETSFTRSYETGLLLFWGCSALISRRAIQRLRGYDPYIFLWAHEVEFTMRLLDAGLRHLYLPEVVAVHDKMPPQEFSVAMHQRNMQHFAYIATKHLRPWDAAGALGNLAVRILTESMVHPEVVRLLPRVLRGARDGLKRRGRPMRPEVSRLYRCNFVEFVSPLRWVRGPFTRWRTSGIEDADKAERHRRHKAFREARRLVYPTRRAALRV